MAGVPVLLAGTVGVGRQDHQSSMWAPALTAAGLVPVGVWSPGGDDERERATLLAKALNVPFTEGDLPRLDPGTAIVACLRGADRQRLLAAVGPETAVLVDKPTLDSTAEIDAQLVGAATTRLLSGHHLAAHPSFTRAAAAVRDGEIGLLRAVMIDLVVAAGDGPSPEGDLRNIGAHVADLMLRLTGPATITLATSALAADAVTFLGQTERDVVLSGHVSRTASGEGILLARMRVVGTHGHIDVDLTRPALHVRTGTASRFAGYGTGSVVARLRELRRLSDGARPGESAASWLAVSWFLDAVQESAQRGIAVTVNEQG